MVTPSRNPAPTWVLLTYRVPRAPTAARVFVWRRLRRLGALRVHDAAWALPRTPFTQEQVQWLASEIRDLKGEATVWIAETFPRSGDEALVHAFADQADHAFAQIAADAARRGARTAPALVRKFQEACRRDYFHSPCREKARAALISIPGGKERAARGGDIKKRRSPS